MIALGLCMVAGCDSQANDGSPMSTAANETAAQMRLRSIVTAEQSYKAERGSYGSLEQLIEKGFLQDPSKGKLSGYKYEIQASKNSFQATAVPEEFGVTGKRSFFIDQSCVLRGRDRKGEKAQVNDPTI